MAEPNEFEIGAFQGKEQSTSGGGSRSTREYEQLPDGVFDLIVYTLNDNKEDAVFPLHTADAAEVPEPMREYFGLDDEVTHQAVEQFAPFDIDAEGIGTEVKVTYEMLEESVSAGYLSDDELSSLDVEPDGSIAWVFDDVESSPQSDLATIINGFYRDEIVEEFGDDAKIRVMAGPLGHSELTAAHDRYTHSRFYVSRSTQAPLSRERARVTVGEIEQSEFEEWAESHGFEDKV